MLTWLRVRDLAIIDSLELELGAGLNIVTGPTGAGKSILVSALELLLGAPGQQDLVRSGAKRAEVEALFEFGSDSPVAERLLALGIEAEYEFTIRRVLSDSGRTRAFVNGQLITRPQLVQLARGLLDISSQHEHHTLSNPASHLAILDTYGSLGPLKKRVRQAYFVLRQASTQLQAFEASLLDRRERETRLRSQVAEVESLAPEPGEDTDLERACVRLRHAERLYALCNQANELLYEGDDSVVEALAAASLQLCHAARLDPEFTPLSEQLDGVRVQVEECARVLARHVASLGESRGATAGQELASAEERLHELGKLKRRYGGSLESVLSQLDQARQELEALEDHTDTLAKLRQSRASAHDDASRNASRLSAKRKAAAIRLSNAITRQLDSLGMGEAKVIVEVSSLRASENGTELDSSKRLPSSELAGSEQHPASSPPGSDAGRSSASSVLSALGPDGADRAEFLIAPNRGECARPLHRIASGGELSRAMLAIKCVLAESALGDTTTNAESLFGTYVFDEVDSGIGGAMAEIIGRKIRSVATHRQVLCITHLPQIAVFADQHFKVEKSVVDDRTLSTVRRLSSAERREEIARMLGGLRVTSMTRAAAREMLTQAKSAA